jgi:uncharacterized membrane protein
MPRTYTNEDAEPGKHRLETLTDGVFAIAMTILVFGLHVQRFAGAVSAPELTRALLSQWPGLAAFALSFVVLGQFWVSMHSQFRVIRRADHWLIWLNIAYLLFISLVPFTADHLGRYGAVGPVVVLYGLNLLALSVLQLGMWLWATGQRRLVASDLPSQVIRQGRSLALLNVGGYAVAAAVGVAVPFVSAVIFVLIPLMSITRVDHWLVSSGDGWRDASVSTKSARIGNRGRNAA